MIGLSLKEETVLKHLFKIPSILNIRKDQNIILGLNKKDEFEVIVHLVLLP